MAKVKIQGNASGTGVLTVTAPNTSTDRTITLPDSTGTLATTSDSTSGATLQQVQATTNTRVTSSTNTYVDTGLTATITPSSTSNKIKISVSQMGLDKRTGNAFMKLQLLRDSTAIWSPSSQLLYDGTTDPDSGSCTVVYLDSPSTTSAVTYKTQFASDDNNAQVAVQWNNSTSVILVEEIKA